MRAIPSKTLYNCNYKKSPTMQDDVNCQVLIFEIHSLAAKFGTVHRYNNNIILYVADHVHILIVMHLFHYLICIVINYQNLNIYEVL